MITNWKNFDLKIHKKGGGGGGGAGVVDYPAHMKAWHTMALSHNGVDTLTSSITDIMNVALGADPYTGETAYNPDADITVYETAIADFNTLLATINEAANWAALFVQSKSSIGIIPNLSVSDMAGVDGITEAEIDADVLAFGDQLDVQLTNAVYPRFEAGMRDINAVVSSAFPIGRTVIEEGRNIEVAKHASALRLAAEYKNADIELEVGKTNINKDVEVGRINAMINTENIRSYLEGASQMLRFLMQKYSWEEAYMKVVVEGKRIKIVAKKEQTDTNLEIDESAATWDLNVFQHGANLLASIGGGTMVPGEKKKGAISSAIGGALTGAAAGYMLAAPSAMGGPVGAVLGGLLGAASSLL